MKNHQSPEAIAARANQQDPIIMYLIVRESLKMSTGKIAAQVGHAVGMFHLEYAELTQSLAGAMTDHYIMFSDWLDSSFRKVVLSADDKEWKKVKEEYADYMVEVIDNGLTEVPSGSATVIGLWPMKKSQSSKVIKKLRLLK